MDRKQPNKPKLTRLPGESMDAYEARFVMGLSHTDLKNLLMVTAVKIKDLFKQQRIIKREIDARGLK